MHPDQHAVANQSLAEAIIPVDQETRLHFHRHSEEIYHITAGTGSMTLGDEQVTVTQGDTIRIAPGVKHCIKNTGQVELTILCSCAPAYSHDDTVLVE
jgi:mannose-6-phosphate isomerase-like protein (cupin superfamily)